MKAKKMSGEGIAVQKNKALQIRAVTETALCSALIAVSAMISVPFPVPFTLQILGVYFALFYLGAVRGAVAVLLYFAIGAIGLPVFSGFSGGVGRLFDATGGFILGFLLLSLIYLLVEKLLGKGAVARCLATGLSLVAFYALGSAWYFFVYNGGEGYLATLSVTVLPFIVPDILKIFLAGVLSRRLSSIFYKKMPEKQKND